MASRSYCTNGPRAKLARPTLHGLVKRCGECGLQLPSGVEVTGYDLDSGRVRKALPSAGDIARDLAVLGLGAWTPGTGACTICPRS